MKIFTKNKKSSDPLLKRIEITGRKVLMSFFSVLQPRKIYDSLPSEYHPRRILLMRQDKVGDMVVTLPFFRALKRAVPQAEIVILASRVNREILKYDRQFKKIIYDKRPWKFLWSLWKVFLLHPDVVIDLQLKESATSTLYVLASRAKWRIRAERPMKLPFNVYVRIGDDWHIRQEMAVLFGSIAKIQPESVSQDVSLSEREEAFAIKFFSKISVPQKRCVGLNISAGKPIRVLKLQENVAICKHLRKRGMTPILLYSPQDEPVARNIARLARGAVLSPKTPDILHAAALLNHTAMLISPDTSIIHIASALGIPTVGLYTANDWNCNRWLPWGVPYRYVQSKQRESMEGINLSEVFEKIDSLLKEIT